MAIYVYFPSCSKSGGPDDKANATAKALDMSLHYSFVTPLTSMVVTKPETEDGTDSPLIADKLTEGKGGKRALTIGFMFSTQCFSIIPAEGAALLQSELWNSLICFYTDVF